METEKRNWRTWVGWGISVLSIVPFLPSAFMKFRPTPQVLDGMAQMGFSVSLLTPLGILETACVVLYLIPQTAVLGAILLTGYLGGAICTHLRVNQPFVMPVILGLLVWLGIYLREARLWAVVPWRK
jgi:hypothetical protein